MKIPWLSLSLFYIATVLLFHLHFVLTIVVKIPVPDPRPPNPEDRDYIHSSCQATLYPKTCFHSLSQYANRVHQKPVMLAAWAVAETLYEAKRMAVYVSNVSVDYAPMKITLHDILKQIRQALGQMEKLINDDQYKGDHVSLEFGMSNVQTWMREALTNVEDLTCTVDGYKKIEPLKMDVCDRATKLKEVTINALMLVSSFANVIHLQRSEL